MVDISNFIDPVNTSQDYAPVNLGCNKKKRIEIENL